MHAGLFPLWHRPIIRTVKSAKYVSRLVAQLEEDGTHLCKSELDVVAPIFAIAAEASTQSG